MATEPTVRRCLDAGRSCSTATFATIDTLTSRCRVSAGPRRNGRQFMLDHLLPMTACAPRSRPRSQRSIPAPASSHSSSRPSFKLQGSGSSPASAPQGLAASGTLRGRRRVRSARATRSSTTGEPTFIGVEVPELLDTVDAGCAASSGGDRDHQGRPAASRALDLARLRRHQRRPHGVGTIMKFKPDLGACWSAPRVSCTISGVSHGSFVPRPVDGCRHTGQSPSLDPMVFRDSATRRSKTT
jgi:hypothetical protein